jgi:hypothetical protein
MSTRSSLHEPATTAINPNPDIDVNRTPRRDAKPAPTKLAPFPGIRTGDDDDPFSLPAPKEGETPPVMITQDTSSPGRTISTMFDPKDQLEPVPPTPPGGGTGETPVDTTVAISSSDIMGLSTTPKLLVPVPAGASLEFLGATGAYTFGTVPYTGAGSLQIKCGGTVVSNDVPVTAITGGASGDVTFTALPGITLQADMPITLTQTGGSLTGGDGTLSLVVNTSTHLPPAGDAQAQSASAAPKSTVGTSLYARKNR